jgi:hypothetical protein
MAWKRKAVVGGGLSYVRDDTFTVIIFFAAIV